MILKFIFSNIKNILKKKNEPGENCVDLTPAEEKDFVPPGPVTYDLKHGNNTIMISGREVIVSALIPHGKNIRIFVDTDGKINLYNKGGYAVEFVTSENLDITFVENDNPKFKLKGGSGHDKIVINEDVILDDIHGGNGNDEIVNNGTAYNIYGGDGDDTITNNGVVNSIYGEDGNDTVINNGIVSKYIDVGADNDHVINNAEVGRYITGGDGTDKLLNNGNIAWSLTEGFENITGEVNGILYIDGEKFSGIYKDGLMYQDGRLLTGISPINNKNYEKGVEVTEN